MLTYDDAFDVLHQPHNVCTKCRKVGRFAPRYFPSPNGVRPEYLLWVCTSCGYGLTSHVAG